MNRTELRDLEARYGRRLDEREALHLLRQERERSMRENEFYGLGERKQTDAASSILPSVSGNSMRGHASPAPSVPQATEQIVYEEEKRWPAWVPLAIFVALFIGEAWLAAHYHVIDMIRGWFR